MATLISRISDVVTAIGADIKALYAGKATIAQADVAANTNAATPKATPVDADLIPIIDSASSFALKKLTWANLKATLKTYFDTLYATIANLDLKANIASPTFTGTPAAPTATVGTNTTQLATTAFVIANTSAAFPAGTRMTFNQTAAPTGWTKDTTAALNDSIMRIVTGSVSSGGSTAFSTFNGQTSVGATTLNSTQIPSHAHIEQIGSSAAVPAKLYSGSSGTATRLSGTSQAGNNFVGDLYTVAAGGGGSHTHSLTTSIKYNDFIIASKN